MVNVSHELEPYIFQFLTNGIIIFMGLPPELYDAADKLYAQYKKLCDEVNSVRIEVQPPKINADEIEEVLSERLKEEAKIH